MQKLVFATNNPNKIREIKKMLGDSYDFLSLEAIDCHEDIPETRPTIEGNALQKAEYVKEHYGWDCFGEDTGLEIEALGGAPGVYTARYAGEAKDPEANMAKVLKELEGETNRRAQFKTVIALIINGQTKCFTGIIKGEIAEDYKRGDYGFGYDPIFIPDGYETSFAQMPPEEKHALSHRGQATRQLQAFLEAQNKTRVS
ncbi:MAG: non-canonical purine NTP diphosphatase [Saprospiraceae bacterium]|nr:non-canonical purine NTP diphosphatase [Saprospiraceae bacterium]